jgi:FMN reductase (NADPH)/FMN reductase [NAD(P)H]
MLVFGYPTPQQLEREYTPRFDEKFIVFENTYRQLERAEFDEMLAERQSRLVKIKSMREQGIVNVAQATYVNKFSAEFSKEMRRSVREILKVWMK